MRQQQLLYRLDDQESSVLLAIPVGWVISS